MFAEKDRKRKSFIGRGLLATPVSKGLIDCSPGGKTLHKKVKLPVCDLNGSCLSLSFS